MKAFFLIISLLILTCQYFALAQCDRASIINDYLVNYQANNFTVDDLNWTGNTNTCYIGNFNNSVNTKMLNRLKFLRRLCALNDDITFLESLNIKCRDAVLMFEKNETISHCAGANDAPCNNWQCTSTDAIFAAQRSNLSYGDWDYHDPVDLYILEEGDFNNALPHMKWILYSKAKTFGNALGPNTNVMYIYNNFGNPSMNQKPYIAFPPEGFVPATIVKNKWFFAIPNASFTNANVTIKNENGNNIPLTITTRNQFYGDKAITWIVNNIDTESIYDKNYTVTVSGINNASASSYTYSIKIAQPMHPPPCPNNLVWSDNDCACVNVQSCAQNLTISNENLTTGVYKVANQLTVQNSTVISNQNVSFIAENRVVIKSDFRLNAGTSLKIDIQSCP